VILCTCYLLFGSNLADIYCYGDRDSYSVLRWVDYFCLLVFYTELILLCYGRGREYYCSVRMMMDVLVILGLQVHC
jgi:hypothetical protein